MLFNTFSYIIFLPVVTVLYYCSPQRIRWIILLLASIFFYTVFVPWYTLIFFTTIYVTYVSGTYLDTPRSKNRKSILIAAIVINLIPLLCFKYLNFFQANIASVAQFLGWNYSYTALTLLLPLGISFHTFQSISYLVEVYRGRQQAERHIGMVALYLMFFPQLVAGPIERPQHMLHQFREHHPFDAYEVTEGLKRIALGFFKKIVLADRLSLIASDVFARPADFGSGMVWLGVLAFSIQIYCDFSGYSDIAIGSARILGFKLTENFNNPYGSKSITEFWRRWHISLSTWFRDYIYIPLGGNRLSQGSRFAAIIVTFLISGLWHGAQWTFILWGAIHGFCIAIERLIGTFSVTSFTEKPLRFTISFIRTLFTFLLVSVIWVLFRANSTANAWYILTRLVDTSSSFLISFRSIDLSHLSFTSIDVIVSCIAIHMMLAIEYINRKQNILYRSSLYNWVVYAGMTIAILNFGVMKEIPFIYFQF